MHPTFFPPNFNDESLLSSGYYNYLRNGVPTGIRESWTIHRAGDGSIITRSERDASVFGSRIRVWAQATTANTITQFGLDWSNSTSGAVPVAQALYTIDTSSIYIARVVDGVKHAEILTRPAQFAVSPLMRVFYGPVLAQLTAADQPLPVLVPWIHNTTDRQMLLSAQLDPRQAWLIGVDEIEIGSRIYPTKRYEYVGGNYTAASQFWVDEAGILLRYTFAQSADVTWDTILSSYNSA